MSSAPPALWGAAAVGLPILFYLSCGAASGLFAADDFVWLTSVRDGDA